jgi:hypothetical protein
MTFLTAFVSLSSVLEGKSVASVLLQLGRLGVEGRMAVMRQAVSELLVHQRCLEGALYKNNGGFVST